MLFNDPFAVPRDMDLGFTCDDLRDAVVDRVDIYLEGDVGAHRQLPSAPRRGGLEGDPGHVLRRRRARTELCPGSSPMTS